MRLVKYNGGYTLMEVLIALCVVSLGVIATATVLQQSIYQQKILTDKHQALWVAEEVLNRQKLALMSAQSGDVAMFNRRWHWVVDAGDNNNITVKVKKGNEWLASLKSTNVIKSS